MEVVDDVVVVVGVVDVVVVDVTNSLVVVIMVVVIVVAVVDVVAVVVVVIWLQPLIQSSTFSLSTRPGPLQHEVSNLEKKINTFISHLMQHLQASVKEQV